MKRKTITEKAQSSPSSEFYDNSLVATTKSLNNRYATCTPLRVDLKQSREYLLKLSPARRFLVVAPLPPSWVIPVTQGPE